MNSELRNWAIDSIYRTFARDCVNINTMIASNQFENIAQNAYKSITKEKIKDPSFGNQPFVIRLAGQSGSGKTTQLLPAIMENIDKRLYVHLAVRNFATLHPDYEVLKENFGTSEIREKTNGFALLMLFRVLELLIEKKYNILFEVTLLDPAFEEYLAKKTKAQGYHLIYNIIALSKTLSDNFILKRLKEENRAVHKNSANYFFNILPKAIKKLIDINEIFDNKDLFILWTLSSKSPYFVSHNCNEALLKTYMKARKENDGNELLAGKKEFFKQLFAGFNLKTV
jgi:predicted ABC-type ATPase